ncbi:hypothetical protein FHX14_005555 [Rhizobium sp. BK619]|nr:hypothetical protein [Rhizobium sp. BK619]
MKKQRFTEEHSVLKEQEAGGNDLCRQHGISEANNWKAKYGGMEVSKAKRLRALRTRPSRCWMRSHSASFLQKTVGPAAKRGAVKERASSQPT